MSPSESMAEARAIARSSSPELGGPTTAAWREEMLTRAQELDSLSSWIQAHPARNRPDGKMFESIEQHLWAARQTAAGKDARLVRRIWSGFTGSAFERTLGNLDAVEVDLLRLAPRSVLDGTLPSIEAHVNRFLPKDDPRRLAVEGLIKEDAAIRAHEAQRSLDSSGRRRRFGQGLIERLGFRRGRNGDDTPGPVEDARRDILVGAQHAANTQRRRDLVRLRSFRNLLLASILVFAGIGVGLGLVAQADPSAMPLCFTPEADGQTKLVCPRAERALGAIDRSRTDLDEEVRATVTSGDVWLVELVGLLAAALTGAAALRSLKAATSTPYAIHVSLAVLKLPTGAVTAVVGLLLMRADFVPGLSALDNSAQILGWAVVFGIAQQLVTRFADSQATGLLESIGGRGAAGDRPVQS